MDWSVVLPRLAGALAPGAVLVYFDEQRREAPWDEDLARIVPRYSTNQDYRPVDLEAEVTSRGLFEVLGRRAIAPVPHEQAIDAYVESLHSRNGLSRDAMGPAAADAFDREIRAAVGARCPDGVVRLAVDATVVWGRPLAVT
jgi:hypothetical protein